MSSKAWIDKDDDGNEIIRGKIVKRIARGAVASTTLDEAETAFVHLARDLDVKVARGTIQPVSVAEDSHPHSEVVVKTYEFTGRREYS